MFTSKSSLAFLILLIKQLLWRQKRWLSSRLLRLGRPRRVRSVRSLLLWRLPLTFIHRSCRVWCLASSVTRRREQPNGPSKSLFIDKKAALCPEGFSPVCFTDTFKTALLLKCAVTRWWERAVAGTVTRKQRSPGTLARAGTSSPLQRQPLGVDGEESALVVTQSCRVGRSHLSVSILERKVILS